MSPASCPALAGALALLLSSSAFAAGFAHHGGQPARHVAPHVAGPAPGARALAPVVTHRMVPPAIHVAARHWTPPPAGLREREHRRHGRLFRQTWGQTWASPVVYAAPVAAWQPEPEPRPEIQRVIQYVPVERPLSSDYAEPPLQYYFSCAGPAIHHAPGAAKAHRRHHAGQRAPEVLYGLHSPCGARQARAAWGD